MTVEGYFMKKTTKKKKNNNTQIVRERMKTRLSSVNITKTIKRCDKVYEIENIIQLKIPFLKMIELKYNMKLQPPCNPLIF